MKVGIIGAGPAGLACALECENLGLRAVIYERNVNVGWPWPSMNIWPKVMYNHIGDPRQYLLENYNVDFVPLHKADTMVMKSPNKEAVLKGNLGLTVTRGKADESLENQLLLQINKTPIYYNASVNYKDLAKEYDYVVVASGREDEAKDMGLWEQDEVITIIGGVAIGSFDTGTSIAYFNTEYAGTGYGRLTPFNHASAIVDLYIIGKPGLRALEYFDKFRKMEKLDKLDFAFMKLPPPFTTGRISGFRKDNILLAGRSAGLVDRMVGVGAVEALISGTMAARAIASGEDYDKMIKPLKEHIESISAFRRIMDNFTNDDFDKLVAFLGTPGIKDILYKTNINFAGILGNLFNVLNISETS